MVNTFKLFYALLVFFLFPISFYPVVANVKLQNPKNSDSINHESGIPLSPCQVDIHTDWMACRYSNYTHPRNISLATTVLPDDCIPAVIPGTILTTLIKNGTFPDPFYEDNLKRIPDISTVGREFYTFVFVHNITLDSAAFRFCTTAQHNIVLHIRAASYRVHAYMNGKKLIEDSVQQHKQNTLEGSFLRLSFRLTKETFRYHHPFSHQNNYENRLAILVEPVIYPGKNTNGQGGDHKIAKNAAVMQYTAGWDWIQATPDRNTGLWDKIYLETHGDVVIKDPYVQTVWIDVKKKLARIKVFIILHNYKYTGSGDGYKDSGKVRGNVKLRFGGDKLLYNQKISILPNSQVQVSLGVHNISDVEFWWPHTHGTPYLYPVDIYFEMESGELSHHLHFQAGIRYVHTWVDKLNYGRVFEVNKERIFILGGNWITTDQFQRHAVDKWRYRSEIRMHKEAGLNMIRIWGGGLAEKPEFYEACDEAGILVMQEFWMTGDNNGRWAGQFDWPISHHAYVGNVRDTVLLLRHHPSLLLWCGGNELYPEGKSPPTDILLNLQKIIHDYSPGIFFIPSSMTSYTNFNPQFSLAPKDGPYGILNPHEYFSRNPGLYFDNNTRADNLLLGFNPEIGSVSTPVVDSMRQFMSEETLAKFPQMGAKETEANAIWVFHKYISYTTAGGHDLIYAYGTPLNIDEYCAQAQLVQFVQYQSLFEGYQEYMWHWYTGMVMWKSQSPWPALRGALYDSWLEYTGGFWGVKAALRDKVHVQFNRLTQSATVINKGLTIFPSGYIKICLFNAITGHLIDTFTIITPPIESQSVYQTNQQIWPPTSHDGKLTIVFIDICLYENHTQTPVSRTQYWQNNPLGSPEAQNFSVLGEMRRYNKNLQLSGTAIGRIALKPLGGLNSQTSLEIILNLKNSNPARIAFFIRLQVISYYLETEESILSKWPNHTPFKSTTNSTYTRHNIHPVWYSHNYFSLLGGESNQINIEIDWARKWKEMEKLCVYIEGWNTVPLTVPVILVG